MYETEDAANRARDLIAKALMPFLRRCMVRKSPRPLLVRDRGLRRCVSRMKVDVIPTTAY
jgi:hypothetical protein